MNLRLQYLRLLGGIVLTMLVACATHDPVSAPIQTAESTQTATPKPSIVFEPPSEDDHQPFCQALTPTSQNNPSAAYYHLDVNVDYDENLVTVSQIIDYTNTASAPLSEIPIIVPPADEKDAFTLTSLQIDPAFSKSNINFTEGVIRLQLDPPLEPSEILNLDLIFSLSPPRRSGSFGRTDRQLLLANWYPFIPPYQQDKGWLVNTPADVGETLTYTISNITVNLQLLPAKNKLTVAASAPLIFQNENCLQYAAENVRNFSLGISPEYRVSSAVHNGTEIWVYTFPEHANMGQRAADLAIQAWEEFTNLYGDNQRQFMSVVEAEIDDGLECDGLFFLSDWYFQTADETPKNYFELLVVHETSHQWFYGLVHNDQAHEPWLDESLATYSELLFYERHYPELVNWWWDYRVHEYNPSGHINATVYEFSQYRPYINAVYLRSVIFLQKLREDIGDEAFFEFLWTYSQSGEEDILRDSDFFFDLLTQITDNELSSIKSGFFR